MALEARVPRTQVPHIVIPTDSRPSEDTDLATGLGITVREFIEIAFSHAGLNWEDQVRFDERYLRPTEVDALIGDSSKAPERLGWTPTVDGRELTRLMVDADIEALAHVGTPWIDTVTLDTYRSPIAAATR